MPELPEVERARKLIENHCKGYLIKDVFTSEDKLVYENVEHHELKKELTGRTILGGGRKGKIFWFKLSGKGRIPVCHFGMNGMLRLKGVEPEWYVRKMRRKDDSWPPKYSKPGSVGTDPVDIAFLDSRRFGRIRLLPEPVTAVPPLSALGFDPLLEHPPLDRFTTLLRSRPRSTIKGLILDQSFSAGIGNWVADEILHLSRIHPATPVHALDDESVKALHEKMSEVVKTAVDVDARHRDFPKNWLFPWRWSKGKGRTGMKLPDGEPATLDFITVGGRTTAYVTELQKLPDGIEYKEPRKRSKRGSDGESSLTLSDEEEDVKPAKKAPRKKPKTEAEETDTPNQSVKRKRKRTTKTESAETDTKPKLEKRNIRHVAGQRQSTRRSKVKDEEVAVGKTASKTGGRQSARKPVARPVATSAAVKRKSSRRAKAEESDLTSMEE